MTKPSLTRWLVVLLAMIPACSGSVEDSPSGDGDGDAVGDGDGDDPLPSLEESLEGRSFVLESAEGYTLVADTTAVVSFQSGEFTFNAGCNGHFADVDFEGNVLKVEGFSSTLIGCDEALHGQDTWFAEFFTSSPTVTLDGDRVTFGAQDLALVFVDDAVANPAPPLVGTLWEVSTLIDGEVALGGFESTPTVTFNEDGTVRVVTGCNTGEGTHEHTESTIDLGEIPYTEAGCPSGERADVEAHIQAVFTEGMVTYSFNGQTLAIDRGALGVRASASE